jgi:hypothetical protein
MACVNWRAAGSDCIASPNIFVIIFEPIFSAADSPISPSARPEIPCPPESATAIALPNNVLGKNFNGLTFNSGSGLNSFIASVSEPYYSDGTKSCGIHFYVDTTDANQYVFFGEPTASMTYVKIA